MFTKMYVQGVTFLNSLRRDERGVTAIEYAVIAAAMAGVLALFFAVLDGPIIWKCSSRSILNDVLRLLKPRSQRNWVGLTSQCDSVVSVLLLISVFIGYRDLKARFVSNKSICVVLVLALVSTGGAAFSPVHFGAAVIIGLVLFATGAMAGGDIKLMLAYLAGIQTELWLDVLLLTAFFGGALASVLYWLWDRNQTTG